MKDDLDFDNADSEVSVFELTIRASGMLSWAGSSRKIASHPDEENQLYVFLGFRNRYQSRYFIRQLEHKYFSPAYSKKSRWLPDFLPRPRLGGLLGAHTLSGKEACQRWGR